MGGHQQGPEQAQGFCQRWILQAAPGHLEVPGGWGSGGGHGHRFAHQGQEDCGDTRPGHGHWWDLSCISAFNSYTSVHMLLFSVSHVMLSLYLNPMWFRTRCRNIQFAFGFESCTTFVASPPTSECLCKVRKTWAFDTRVLELKWVGARQISPRPLRVRGDHVRGESWTEASERMYTVRMHRPFLATWNMSKRGGPHINHGSSGDFHA